MFFNGEWTKQIVSGFLTGTILICATVGMGQDLGLVFSLGGTQGPEVQPSWWKARGVLDPDKTLSNPSVVNVGQLKWVTRQLHEELSTLMPAEANFFALNSVVPASPQAFERLMPYDQNYTNWITGNQSAASLGQVKNCAVKFYDVLHSISPAWVIDQMTRSGHPADGRKYPWTETNADDQNKAAANIGQLKSVFSLRLRESLDDDLLPDIFELALIKYVPEFAGKSLNDITWNPGDTVISFKGTDSQGAPVTTQTNTQVPNLGGSGSGSLSASALLAEHQPVGSVGGAFAVGGDGAANYTVPISIPKGTSGVEPQIALSYSSGGGNGALGVGFDISGFQRITRGTTSRLKDGFVDPVDFDDNDRFFFDGELLIATKNKAGNAASAADYGKDGTVYQTESNGFARIISHGQVDSGPSHWTVETKAGLTIELGNCPSSCVSSAALAGKGVLVWNVNRVSDNVGNYYSVTYQLGDEGSSVLDYRLAQVKYTGNGSTLPYNEIHFQWGDRPDVSLGYIHGVKITNKKRLKAIEIRAQGAISYYYELGYAEKLSKRASHLTSLTKCLNSGNKLPPTIFSWKSDNSQTATTQQPSVNWQAGTTVEGNVSLSSNASGSEANGFLDMNSDGLLDCVTYKNGSEPGIWVSLNTGSGYLVPQKWMASPPAIPTDTLSYVPAYPSFPTRLYAVFPIHPGPYPSDILRRSWWNQQMAYYNANYPIAQAQQNSYDAAYNAAVAQFYNTVAARDAVIVSNAAAIAAASEGTLAQNFFTWKNVGSLLSGFIDMNGDSLPDRVNSRNGADHGLWVFLNTGSGFAPATKWWSSVQPENNYLEWNYQGSQVNGLVDFNGDGLPDRVAHYNYNGPDTSYGLWVSLNTGNGFAPARKWWSSVHPENNFLEWNYQGSQVNGLVDFNGDGLPDRVAHYDFNNPALGYGLWVSLNTGSGFAPATKWWSSVHPENNFLEWDWQGSKCNGIFDVNGDGLPDRVAHYNYNGPEIGYGLWVSLNTGSAFAPATKWWSSVYPQDNFLEWDWQGSKCNGIFDVNGDGLPDRVAHYNYNGPEIGYGLWVSLNSGNNFAAATKWWSSPKDADNFLEWKDGNSQVNGFLDLNSDGLPDRISQRNQYPNGEIGTWASLNSGSGFSKASVANDIGDRITSIKDGLGAEILIDYKRGSDDSVDNSGRRVYTKPAYNPAEVASGIIGVNGAGYLVSRYAEQDGVGGFRRMRQYYGERKMDRINEEDLGFKWIESVDEQRGHGSITRFSQVFPYNGLPLESFSYIPSGADKIITSRQAQSYDQHAQLAGIGGKIHFAFLKTSTSWDYAFEGDQHPTVPTLAPFKGTALSSVVVTNGGFDNHGNLTSSTSTSSDGFTTTSSNVYGTQTPASGEKWILGRLSSATVTKSGPAGYTPVTKSSAFTYYDSGPFVGMLKTEIAEPTQPSAVEKSYTYDTWGNKSSTTIRALNGDQAPRTSYVKYDPTGRFPVEEWNDLNHKATHYYDQKRSLHLGSTGANGLTTRYFYDPWGTRILTRGPDGTEAAEISRYATAADVPAGPGLDPVSPKIVFIRKTQSTGAPATTAYIDAQGRVLMSSAESFDGRLVFSRKDYDVHGRSFRESLPFFASDTPLWSELKFDDADRPWKSISPDNSFSTIEYKGFTTITTNASNQKQTRVQNAQGWLTRVKDNNDNIIDYTYTVDGKPKETLAPGSRAIETDIDTFGQTKSMKDPNVGLSKSEYYAFGEVKKTTDGKNATTEFTYDILGRQKTRVVKDSAGVTDSITTWVYDTAPGAGLGKIHTTEMKNGLGATTHFSTIRYDSLGRPTETTTTHHGETFRSSVAYDALSRPRTETDAGGLSILHEYDARGFETGIRDYLTGQLYWKPLEYDASGRLLREELGNGVVNTHTFDQARGTLTASQSLKGTAVLQKMQYEWDAIGNFKKRTDLRQNISETFLYEDGLNRLTSSQVTGKPALAYTYDPNGNLKSKANVGTYSYTAAARPHAVTSIAATSGVTRTFDYDANGAFTIEKRNGQTYREVVWAAHQNVKEFKLTGGPRVLKVNGTELYAPGNTTTTFDYDAGFSRSQKITERDQLQREVTLYLGSYERIVSEDRANTNLAYTVQKIEHRHSIGGLALKTFTQQGGVTSEDTVYYLKDHLGSLTATVDVAGVVKERYSFDAWGSRRDAATWSDSTYDALTKVTTTNRGYTGHEMLDELGIVHMNGRLYDPEIARVLSGDPVIQAPEDSQNYNRYSYVINNPLSLTDPSGFSFWGKVTKSIKKAAKKIAKVAKNVTQKVTKWVAENQWAATVVTVVVGIATLGVGLAVGAAVVAATSIAAGTLTAAVATGVIAGAVGGFLSGAVNSALAGGRFSDIIKGAFVGGLQGAAAGGLHFVGGIANIVGHGLVGGVANELMGGKFQDGFLSAATGAGLNGALGALNLYGTDKLLGVPGDGSITRTTARTMIVGIAGGTAAAIGGGKFANGFYTAAIQHLYNAEMRDPNGGWSEDPPKAIPLDKQVLVFKPQGLYSYGNFNQPITQGLLYWIDKGGDILDVFQIRTGGLIIDPRKPAGSDTQVRNGVYSVSNWRASRPGKDSFTDFDLGISYSLDVNPLNWGVRSVWQGDIRIHPDGPIRSGRCTQPGTAGCLGVMHSNNDHVRFFNRSSGYFKNSGSINLHVIRP